MFTQILCPTPTKNIEYTRTFTLSKRESYLKGNIDKGHDIHSYHVSTYLYGEKTRFLVYVAIAISIHIDQVKSITFWCKHNFFTNFNTTQGVVSLRVLLLRRHKSVSIEHHLPVNKSSSQRVVIYGAW